MRNTLPIPSPEAKKYSDALLDQIRSLIEKKGPISFADYMQLALYAPELGYYRNSLPKFGESGDFVTAPEISSLFGQCIAKQCQQVLTVVQDANILEFGAGSGKMAGAILRSLQQADQLPVYYYILEPCKVLQQRQRDYLTQTCGDLVEHVVWLDYLPENFYGIILANEVLDAMPVRKFLYQDEKIQEYYVSYQHNQLCWHLDSPQEEQLIQQVNNLGVDFDADYESEINLLLPGWIASLANVLKQGLILLIDYGFPRHEYYHPDRNHGTIMCHYQHRAHDNPLLWPGIQDITAHVDFTAVAESAYDQGLTISGFTPQAGFLLNCGITELIPQSVSSADHFEVMQQIKRLTLPNEMGELFKVMALTKNYSESLFGFRMMNQIMRL